MSIGSGYSRRALLRHGIMTASLGMAAASLPARAQTAGGGSQAAAATSAENKLAELGIVLPNPTVVPSGAGQRIPISFVRIAGDRVLISGHVGADAQGRIGTPEAGPYGQVGKEISEEAAYQYSRRIGLSILADVKHALGSLDRIDYWTKVLGMVNGVAGFSRQPTVINGFSDLLLQIWGPERGSHARSAVGVAGLPFNVPVEIEAEAVLIRA